MSNLGDVCQETNVTQTSRVARNLHWVGLFWIPEKTLNDLDPDFDRSFIRLSRYYRPKCSDLQKKKVFTEIETVFPAEIRSPPQKKDWASSSGQV